MVFKPVPRPRRTGFFRRLQLVSAAAYSLGHGANDAQKTMGIIMACWSRKDFSALTTVSRSGW